MTLSASGAVAAILACNAHRFTRIEHDEPLKKGSLAEPLWVHRTSKGSLTTRRGPLGLLWGISGPDHWGLG